MTRTAIIIPCYNEAERLIPDNFLNFAAENRSVHFIFVNDGSSDDTPEKISELTTTDPDHFLCVYLKRNAGKAEAVRRGFLRAFEDTYDYIGFWDADLSTPLDTIKTFIDLLSDDTIEIVIGARVRLLGRTIVRKRSRHYLGRVFATIAGAVLRIPVYDTQCGAKLFRNTKALRRVFSRRFMAQWIFDVEVLARFIMLAHHAESSLVDGIVEYPLTRWVGKEGSKVGYSAFLKAPLELAGIFAILYLPGVSYLYAKRFL